MLLLDQIALSARLAWSPGPGGAGTWSSRPTPGWCMSMVRPESHPVQYALVHDDGAVTRSYDAADVIVAGVSRSACAQSEREDGAMGCFSIGYRCGAPQTSLTAFSNSARYEEPSPGFYDS